MKRRSPFSTPERSGSQQSAEISDRAATYCSSGNDGSLLLIQSLEKVPRKITKSAANATTSNQSWRNRIGHIFFFSLVAVLIVCMPFFLKFDLFSFNDPSVSKKSNDATRRRSMFKNLTGSIDLKPTFNLSDAGWSRGAALDMTVPFIHIVNSRFQQHDKNLTAIGEVRLQLFETFCLPSMVQQTIQQTIPTKENSNVLEPHKYRFIWIIKVDPKLDLRLRNRMAQLLKPYPNFYLVGSNKNYGPSSGAGVSWGSWRGGKAGNDVLYGKNVDPNEDANNLVLSQEIYTGDLSMLQIAHAQRDEKIILETRLDSDDGLPLNYLEKIQESAVLHLSSKILSGKNESELDLASTDVPNQHGKLKWMFWCVPHSFNWHPTDLVHRLNSGSSVLKDESGLVTKVKNEFCLTPGLTSGISVGVLASEVPRYSHYVIMKELRKEKNKNICGETKKDQHCIQVLGEVYAIRARTPTSDGMSGVGTLSANKGEEIKWNELSKIFGIREERAILANHHIDINLISILKDNLAGQCTHLKGKLCEASKMAVQKMIDMAVKARENHTVQMIL